MPDRRGCRTALGLRIDVIFSISPLQCIAKRYDIEVEEVAMPLPENHDTSSEIELVLTALLLAALLVLLLLLSNFGKTVLGTDLVELVSRLPASSPLAVMAQLFTAPEGIQCSHPG
jgi:hypothetical protein